MLVPNPDEKRRLSREEERMGILMETLLAEGTRPKVVEECVQLVDAEVKAKKGLTGKVIQMGYKAFTSLKPGIVKKATEHLLDDFTRVLDGHYDSYLTADPGKREPFPVWARKRDSRIADDLLKVTDDIIARSDKRVIRKIYDSLRGTAQRNVAEAVPAVGRLVLRHLG
jgi:hypothetical protein